MKKVAIFGKPGSGKSVFSKRLAEHTGLPLCALDSIFYQTNGQPVPREDYQKAHNEIVSSDAWIIDGLGPLKSFYERLEAADTLIYVDLPYRLSYWFVTKRLFKGLFVTPEGWPEGSSILQGTLNSYKTLRKCPAFWNEDFLQKIRSLPGERRVIVIKSLNELDPVAMVKAS